MQNVRVASLGIPDAVLARARRVADAITRSAADLGSTLTVDADEMLTGRAALLGLAPHGRISAGGATRLLSTRDGWCALTLSRDEDIDAVPAFLEMAEQPADLWTALADAAAGRSAAEFVARARLLDLPAAILGETAPAAPRFTSIADRAERSLSDLLVADLSSMWAGPLCGRLLAEAGATVVKVESPARPDGTRGGDARFFDWMNSSKLSYAIDLRGDELPALLEAADVVIEGSRPTALARRGICPERIPGRPGRVWLRVTGYGSDGECAHRVAFGDDAAVAGGLVGTVHARSAGEDGIVFVGDAIADPLTGLAAARAVLECLGRGGAELVEVALAEVAADYATLPLTAPKDVEQPVFPATVPAAAAAIGADNCRVRDLVAARLASC